MKMELEEAPQTKSLSRCCSILKNAIRYLYQNLLRIFTLNNKSIFTFAPSLTTASAAVNSDVELPQSKIATNPPLLIHPPSLSFSSLSDEIVVSCLALISRSYYPKISLVSKSFHSFIFSRELHRARFHSKTRQTVLHVCLQLPGHRLPSWFSLWIKPDQTLTNDMEEENNNKSTGNTKLVAIPSSYSPRVPTAYIGKVCSKYYTLRQYNTSPKSSPLWVRSKRTGDSWGKIKAPWCKAPRMKVARENPVVGILDGKIYVMGGCKADESTSWAEVFDTKTQTWESLPDPGAELRFSLTKSMKVNKGKVYVESSEKNDHFYDPIEGRWGVSSKAHHFQRKCKIDNLRYSCGIRGFLWYDRKLQNWRVVKGLEVLNKNCRGGVIAIANYGGKLLILWDKFEQPADQCENKNIWCSVIALERRTGDDEVWGNVEWASVVLTVPTSYVFLRYQVKSV